MFALCSWIVELFCCLVSLYYTLRTNKIIEDVCDGGVREYWGREERGGGGEREILKTHFSQSDEVLCLERGRWSE